MFFSKPLLILFSLVISTGFGLKDIHDFHVSKCEIRYNTAKQTLEMTYHIFLDDLEMALERSGHSGLNLCEENESESANKLLLTYLEAHFILMVDETPVTYELIGKEQSEDLSAVWCYLKAKDVDDFSRIEVRNDLLMEVYDDQKNIGSFAIGDDRSKLVLFSKEKPSQVIVFP
jgi:hypothetical protein